MSAPLLTWTELRVLVPRGWHELVAEVLAAGPCPGAAFGRRSLGEEEPPEDRDYVRTWLPSTHDTQELRRDLRSAIASLGERSGEPELEGLSVEFRTLPPEDFATSWRKSWKPFRLGRLCLLPPWDPRAARPGETRLSIEPGAAFGSGRHATTRACLRVLQERLQPGERVLDAGCGSGILSVAAALLGATRALGFDVDPLAVPIARELARQNGVAGACEFQCGDFDLLGPEDVDFDGVLANIHTDAIQAHAAELARRLRPGGWFGFSGCAAARAGEVRRAIAATGLVVETDRARGRWHTFAGRRPERGARVATGRDIG